MHSRVSDGGLQPSGYTHIGKFTMFLIQPWLDLNTKHIPRCPRPGTQPGIWPRCLLHEEIELQHRVLLNRDFLGQGVGRPGVPVRSDGVVRSFGRSARSGRRGSGSGHGDPWRWRPGARCHTPQSSHCQQWDHWGRPACMPSLAAVCMSSYILDRIRVSVRSSHGCSGA